MKFKVGDRVRLIGVEELGEWIEKHDRELLGKVGVVEENDRPFDHRYRVKFEVHKNCGNCVFKEENLELVTDTKSDTKFIPPFYVDCPTEEIWDKVEKKMFDMGYEWFTGRGHADYEEIIDGEHLTMLNVCYNERFEKVNEPTMVIRREGNTEGTYIPYQKFLGEETIFESGDRVKLKRPCSGCDIETIYELIPYRGNLYAATSEMIKRGGGCSCNSNFILIEKMRCPTGTYKTATKEQINKESVTFEKLRRECEKHMEDTAPKYTQWFSRRLNEPDYFYGFGDYGLDTPRNTSFIKKAMNKLSRLSENVRLLLNPQKRNFYKLGWLDEGLRLTADGRDAVASFLMRKFEKELGLEAAKKIREASKKENEPEEDEE